ncbi:MAG: hypothetical protein KJ006_07800 [Thermoleophilia bacterium]|nr:hypothetical protein [Thermoleophilia bacterium]
MDGVRSGTSCGGRQAEEADAEWPGQTTAREVEVEVEVEVKGTDELGNGKSRKVAIKLK